MELLNNLVLPNGTLNNDKILKKEILYKGMNGKFVERFFLSPSESYVFKPLTNNGQLGREVWVYEHILPSFPDIYPKLLAYSIDAAPDLNWMIFEDLGPLTHVFTNENVLGVTKLMARWHSLPTGNFENIPLTGLKPQMDEIISDIFLKKNEIVELLPILKIEEKLINQVYSLLEQIEFSKKLVLSHGDLHLGNFVHVNKRMMVLDWEHTHLNTPYWDLYHVIDMAHPIFPKKVTSQFRKQILTTYLEEVGYRGDKETFLREYYLYSAAFSLWMMLLIFKDLQALDGKWSKEQLEIQLMETVSSFHQCANSLIKS